MNLKTSHSSNAQDPQIDERFQRPEPSTPSEHERWCYGDDVEVSEPENEEELIDIIENSAGKGQTLIPTGLGHHAYLGPPPEGKILLVSTSRMNSIVQYEPEDFTIGVQAGVSLRHFIQELATNDQELALDLDPQRDGTIGGLVAANWHGPRRHQHGLLRSLIIGLSGVRANGVRFKSGGMVVKNVAGYDLGKLLVGSLGTLGVITQINFKLRQRSEVVSMGLGFFKDPEDAFAFAQEFAYNSVEPAILEVFNPEAVAGFKKECSSSHSKDWPSEWGVVWKLEGNESSVETQEREIEALKKNRSASASGFESLETEDLSAVSRYLTQFSEPDDPFRQDLALLRFSLPARNTRQLCRDVGRIQKDSKLLSEGQLFSPLSGMSVIRLRGDRPALKAGLTSYRELAKEASAQGKVLFVGKDLRREQTYSLRADPNRALAEKIQKVFDPKQCLHRSRL